MHTHDEPPSKWPLYLLILALICTTVVSLVYLSRQREQTRELAATNNTLGASLAQLQSDLQGVTERLNNSTRPQAAAIPAAKARQRTKARPVREKPTVAARSRDDPRWNQIQNQLSDQQKQIAGTREDLSKAREDLQGKLDSTRDELAGSIAKSHDELLALEKRGERNYYEFNLDRSKQFRRVGPLSLSLRKADVKRKSYDLAMMVDDNQLQKKKVNLYEPVWINLNDRPQPLELVVNQVDKNRIQGYLSEPKYKKSELQEP